jgi:hypothetical protein
MPWRIVEADDANVRRAQEWLKAPQTIPMKREVWTTISMLFML